MVFLIRKKGGDDGKINLESDPSKLKLDTRRSQQSSGNQPANAWTLGEQKGVSELQDTEETFRLLQRTVVGRGLIERGCYFLCQHLLLAVVMK